MKLTDCTHIHALFPQAVRSNVDIETYWGARRVWAPTDCGNGDDADSSSACSRLCNHKMGRMPNDQTTEFLSPVPVSLKRAIECEIHELSTSVCNAIPTRDGYECLLEKPILVLTAGGCGDDVFGIHVPPTLSKNRPIIPPNIQDEVHEAGVIMPFHFRRHFLEASNALESFSEVSWTEKKTGVVFRGALACGPPPGIAAIQRCGGGDNSKNFRGRPKELFVPGLPWKWL